MTFDWERSGWGPPALDIVRLVSWAPAEGAHEYWRRVETAGPGVSMADVTKLVVVGSLFKLLQAITWEATYVGCDWYARPLATLEIDRQRLKQDLAAMRGWK